MTIQFTAHIGTGPRDNSAIPSPTPQDVRLTPINGTSFGAVPGAVTVTVDGRPTPVALQPGAWTANQITFQAAFPAPGPWQITVTDGIAGVNGDTGTQDIDAWVTSGNPWQDAVGALASSLHLQIPLAAGVSNSPLTPILAQVVQVAPAAALPNPDQVLTAVSSLLPLSPPGLPGTQFRASLGVRWVVSPNPTPPADGTGDPALVDSGPLGTSGVQTLIRPLPLSTFRASGEPTQNPGADTRYLHALITVSAPGQNDIPITLTAGPINVPKLPIVPMFALWRGPEFAAGKFLENHAWPAGPGDDDSAVYIALPTAPHLPEGTVGPFTPNGNPAPLDRSPFGQLVKNVLGGPSVSFGSLLMNQPAGLDQLTQIADVNTLPAELQGPVRHLLAYAQGLKQLLFSVADLVAKGDNPHTFCTVQATRELDGSENMYIINKGGLDALKLEDNTQSAMLFGPPGTTVDLYVLDHLRDDQGHAVISTGDGYVASIPRFGDVGPAVTAQPIAGAFVPAAPVPNLPAGDISVVHAIRNDRGAFATAAAHADENSLAKTVTSFLVTVADDIAAPPMTAASTMGGHSGPMPPPPPKMPSKMPSKMPPMMPPGGDVKGKDEKVPDQPTVAAQPYPVRPVRPSVIGANKELKK
ncbi:MAG: hypothetical protein QOC82_2730 [Frankiaceae bacterium]|jgi:hypothetical protein|nr:hypothetical protein [Frankiaceae bacterium]